MESISPSKEHTQGHLCPPAQQESCTQKPHTGVGTQICALRTAWDKLTEQKAPKERAKRAGVVLTCFLQSHQPFRVVALTEQVSHLSYNTSQWAELGTSRSAQFTTLAIGRELRFYLDFCLLITLQNLHKGKLAGSPHYLKQLSSGGERKAKRQWIKQQNKIHRHQTISVLQLRILPHLPLPSRKSPAAAQCL